jgi:hypothetical protein
MSLESTQKLTMPEKGVSWNFDADDTPIPEPPKSESTRRPRTVTFEPTERPISTATTDSVSSTGAPTSTGEPAYIDHTPQEPRNGSQAVSAPIAVEKKKSRFVVEDSASPSITSPPPSYSADMSPSSSGVISPSMSVNGSTVGSMQATQGLQGLGVSSSSPVAEAATTAEVKKGRFSVKDTTLSITSPSPASLKSMVNDALLSPSRSLSPSPVEGFEGIHIGLPLDLGSAGKI